MMKELSEEEMDIDKVYWDNIQKNFMFTKVARNLRQRYYTWLFNKDDEDCRALLYLPSNGDFKQAVRGEMGRKK